MVHVFCHAIKTCTITMLISLCMALCKAMQLWLKMSCNVTSLTCMSLVMRYFLSTKLQEIQIAVFLYGQQLREK